MSFKYFIHVLSHPVTMVILGSSMGWLFVNYVWKPLNEKTFRFQNNNRYQKEVFLRLEELKTGFENQYSTRIIKHLLNGKTTLNPDYKFWKLDALIQSGWTEYVNKNIQETLTELVKLVEESETTINKQKIKKAIILVETLNIYLKNIKEN